VISSTARALIGATFILWAVGGIAAHAAKPTAPQVVAVAADGTVTVRGKVVQVGGSTEFVFTPPVRFRFSGANGAYDAESAKYCNQVVHDRWEVGRDAVMGARVGRGEFLATTKLWCNGRGAVVSSETLRPVDRNTFAPEAFVAPPPKAPAAKRPPRGPTVAVAKDLYSQEERTSQALQCPTGVVRFSRGLPWTPPDHSVVLGLGEGRSVTLPPNCYSDMTCVTYKDRPAVMLTRLPACGGNAIPEDYVVVDLATGRRTVLTYRDARVAWLLGD
jgi:hypothetical protein